MHGDLTSCQCTNIIEKKPFKEYQGTFREF